MFELALFSPQDMVVVMIVALLVFGPKRLPEVGRQVGQFIREGRKMMSSFTDAMNDVKHDATSPFRDQDKIVPGQMVKDQEPETETPASAEAEKPQLTIAEHKVDEADHLSEPAQDSKSEKPDQKIS